MAHRFTDYVCRAGGSDSSRLWMLLAACCVAALFVLPSIASAESGSVRYSYEQVEIGDRSQWALVPHPEERLKGEVTNSTIRQAFKLLREAKGTSYGNTTIEVSGGSPEQATVKVHIDPDYSKYKLIIMAETVYTLTELGVAEVRFPGFAEGAVGREDIPFSAYTVTVPLWRALPPERLADARIRMPDGSVMPVETLERRWQRGDRALVEALFSYLEDERPYTVVSVAKRLPELDVAYTEKILPLLEHDAAEVRRAALEVLANKRDRQDVLEAVVSMMQNEQNGQIAKKAADFLGEANAEDYAVYQQFFYLERGSKKEQVEAAKKLASVSGDARVVEQLAGALRQSNHSEVASTAASSLLKLEAHEALAEALDDEKVSAEVRMEIARGLAETSDAQARVDGSRYLGTHASGRERRVAVRDLGDVGTEEARRAVESFLTSDDRRIRRVAAETLVSVGSTASLGPIADAVREVEPSSEIEDAGYRILKSSSLSTILAHTEKSDTVVQRMAYRALGPKAASGAGGSDVFARLKKGASHSDPMIRGAAARGLGAYANDAALEVLEKLADDSSSVVRRGVAHGLGNYKNGEMLDKLVSYLDDDPEVVAAALSSLADRQQNEPMEKIKTLVDADEAIVRKYAVIALAQVVPRDDEQAVRKVISMLSGTVTSDENDEVLRTAIRQLGTFEKARAVNGIAIMLNAKDKQMRLTAIAALGESGHTSAVDLLGDTAADSDPEIRRAVIEALGEIGNSRAKSVLQERLQKEKKTELKKLIEQKL